MEFSNLDVDFEIVQETKKSKNKKSRVKSDLKTVETKQADLEPKQADLETKQAKSEPPVKYIEPLKTSNNFLNSIMKMNEEKKKQDDIDLSNKSIEYPYIKKSLMTNAEKQLFHFMKNYLLFKERIEIFSKVRLGDLIDIDTRMTHNSKYFYKIAYKHVDYVIVDNQTLEVICLVELDDYTHDNDEVKQRDEFLKWATLAAELPLYRIRTKIDVLDKDDLRLIENCLAEYYKPKCPYCSSEMEFKWSRKMHNMGHRFYGCINFPKCKYTIDID